MDIGTALRNLVGAPNLLAIRPNGPILTVSDRQLVVDWRSGKPRRYVGKFSDYCAIDWQVVTGEQLAELAGRGRKAAAGA